MFKSSIDGGPYVAAQGFHDESRDNDKFILIARDSRTSDSSDTKSNENFLYSDVSTVKSEQASISANGGVSDESTGLMEKG